MTIVLRTNLSVIFHFKKRQSFQGLQQLCKMFYIVSICILFPIVYAHRYNNITEEFPKKEMHATLTVGFFLT